MNSKASSSISGSCSLLALSGLLVLFLAVGMACKNPLEPGPLEPATLAPGTGSSVEFSITIPGSPPVASAQRATILTDGSVFKVKVYGLKA
ncbi:MAG: hypothetical protein ABIJ86_03535, partial [Spirochaetota bacterium]